MFGNRSPLRPDFERRALQRCFCHRQSRPAAQGCGIIPKKQGGLAICPLLSFPPSPLSYRPGVDVTESESAMELPIGNTTLGMIDLIALAVLILFLVRGLIKGFVSQLAGIVILVGGLGVARAAGPQIRSYVKSVLPDTAGADVDMYVAYFVAFIVFMIVVAIIAKLLKNVLSALRLQSYDRVLGGAVGLILGGAIVIVANVASVLFLPSIIDRDTMKSHMAKAHTPRLAAQAISEIDPLFPEEIRRKLDEFRDELESYLPEEKPEEEASAQERETDGG